MSEDSTRESNRFHRSAAFLDCCCKHFFIAFPILLLLTFIPSWRHPDSDPLVMTWAQRIALALFFGMIWAPILAWKDTARRKRLGGGDS